MGGGLAVSREDSGARTGPHEIGLIAKIAAVSDDDAARRLYRKYRMELFRFGFHVLGDQGLAEEMVGPLLRKRPQTEGADRGARQFPEEPQLLIEGLALKRPAVHRHHSPGRHCRRPAVWLAGTRLRHRGRRIRAGGPVTGPPAAGLTRTRTASDRRSGCGRPRRRPRRPHVARDCPRCRCRSGAGMWGRCTSVWYYLQKTSRTYSC